MIKTHQENVIILFDGVCNLCNGAVTFIIQRDPHGIFRFASLQSEVAQKILRGKTLNRASLESIIVIHKDKLLQKSEAALFIASRLGGGWSLLSVFRVVPEIIRDSIYNLIARNRYAWFGKKDECMIPTPELRSRFLD